MTLIANIISTDETITIAKISEIHAEDNIYYISGKYDPRNLDAEPLTINFNGISIVKAQKIEFDSAKFRNIRLY